MTMKMSDAAAKKALENVTGQLLLAAAAHVQGNLQRALSISYPPASKTGEYPHWRTGNLRASVMIEPRDVRQIGKDREVKVGFAQQGFYGGILELFRGRKGLFEMAKTLKESIAQIVAGIPKP